MGETGSMDGHQVGDLDDILGLKTFIGRAEDSGIPELP
jgi:hypothetical protein